MTLRDDARSIAIAHGINPDYFERQIDQESGFNPNAHNAASGADGIAQIIPRWHPGVDTRDPIASLNYAAGLIKGFLDRSGGSYPHALAAYNWGPGNTFGYSDVQPWDGQRNTLPEETQHYIDIILGVGWSAGVDVTMRCYGDDVPDAVVRQRNDWSCAVRSLYACLYTMYKKNDLPFEPTYGDEGPNDIYNWMVPKYDNSNVGLLDASGAGVVDCLSRHGITAHNFNNVTLAQVQEVAGTKAIMLGSRGWFGSGHWVMLRCLGEDGMLILENPASNSWNGIRDEIRDSFNKPAFGSWSMVVIDPITASSPIPVHDNTAYLLNLIGNAYASDGVVRTALQALINSTSLDPAMYKREIQNIINWLEANRIK